METLLACLKLLLVVALIWPRGYLLIYLIDRSKSFSFGFKFFAGWLLGIAGVGCDVYGSNVFGGTRLLPWLFLLNSVSQIFGFGFMIFLFEKKIPLPRFKRFFRFIQDWAVNFYTGERLDKIVFFILIIVVIFQLGLAANSVGKIPVFGFDAEQNINYQAKTIFYTKNISTDPASPFYFGGSGRIVGLNDSMFKAWLAIADGQFPDRQINYVSLIYYLFLIFIFFYLLPANSPPHFRFMGATVIALLPPVIFSSQNIPVGDWLLSIFLMQSFAALWFFWRGKGTAWYYYSGIALALACWTAVEALIFIFPLMLAAKTVILILKKISLKDYLLDWFFAWLTTIGWICSLVWWHPDLSGFDLAMILRQMIPVFIFFCCLALNTFVMYLRKISSV